MAESPTLLEHLAMTCTTQRENVANEALCHILSSSKAARHALQEMLRDGGAEVGSIARVWSQDAAGPGRPDLAAVDEQDVKRVLIEAKFWAELTRNQPVSYLKALRQDLPTALLFVAPSSRSESLWPELRERVRAAEDIDLEAETRTPELQCAAAGGGRRLMLTSWKALLDRIETHAADDDITADIRQLRGLAKRMDAEAFQPLHPDELAPEFARRLLGLGGLVDDAATRASKEGWLKKYGASALPEGYGRAVSLDGATVQRLAISYDLWAKHPVTPLWLRFDSNVDEVRRRLEPLRREDPPGIREDGNNVVVPIQLPEGVEHDKVLNTVLARLRHLAELICAADRSDT